MRGCVLLVSVLTGIHGAAMLPIDDDFIPTEALRTLRGARAASRRQLDEDRHFAFDPPEQNTTGGGSSSSTSLMEQRTTSAPVMRDGRGCHARDASTSNRVPYAQTAYEHRIEAEEHSMGRACLANCPFSRRCGLNVTQGSLLRAHVYSYGDKVEAKQQPNGTTTYLCGLSFNDVKERRKQLVHT